MPASRWDVEAFYDPEGEIAGKISREVGRLHRRHRSVRPDVLRHHAARSVADGSAAAVAARSARGKRSNTRACPPTDWPARAPACSSASAAPTIRRFPRSFDDYLERIDAHVGTGNALSIAANRLSYIFDFHGPSFAVDTACSSGLVALHLAVQSLRNRECEAALAGGVNCILSPEATIAFSQGPHALARRPLPPVRREANGYVRGEGCGAGAAETPDRRRARRRRRARGQSAARPFNQDGRTTGITAPNSQSQKECIRAALAQARVTPDRSQLRRGARHRHAAGRSDRSVRSLTNVLRAAAVADEPTVPRDAASRRTSATPKRSSGMAGLIKVGADAAARRDPAAAPTSRSSIRTST